MTPRRMRAYNPGHPERGEMDAQQFMNEAMTEDQFLAKVLDEFARRGWLVYHTRDSRRSEAGFPDIVAVRGGRLIFAEVKREKGARVSAAQRHWLDKLDGVTSRLADALHVREGVATSSRHNGLMCPDAVAIVGAYLWRPSDWPEIERVAL